MLLNSPVKTNETSCIYQTLLLFLLKYSYPRNIHLMIVTPWLFLSHRQSPKDTNTYNLKLLEDLFGSLNCNSNLQFHFYKIVKMGEVWIKKRFKVSSAKKNVISTHHSLFNPVVNCTLVRAWGTEKEENLNLNFIRRGTFTLFFFKVGGI